MCCFRFSGVLGELCTSCQFALSYELLLGVVTRIALGVKIWTQKSIPVKLTAWEWSEETVGTLVAGQLFDCQAYPVFRPVLVGLQKALYIKLMGINLLSVQ